MDARLKEFYDREYLGEDYAKADLPIQHSFYPTLKAFIERFNLSNKQCLEIGCGRGIFQGLVNHYHGVDITISVSKYFFKPFYQASATGLPFDDNTFDAIWTYATLEHVPNPERALSEMRRVLKNEGMLLLAPAWQCRPWMAEGFPVRPYRTLNLKGKLIKASIPIRDSIVFRSTYIFPMRAVRSIQYLLSKKPLSFRYKELTPNYDYYWTSDSDAVNSMDPFEAIIWFVSRGDRCLSHNTKIKKFFVRTGALIFKINKEFQNNLQ